MPKTYNLGTPRGRRELEIAITADLQAQYPHRKVKFVCNAVDNTPILIAPVPRIAHIAHIYGAFATQKIHKGEVFFYEGFRQPASQVLPGKADYIYNIDAEWAENCEFIGGGPRFFNHSPNFNFYPEMIETDDGEKIGYVALRDIEPGEQLLVHYGPDYDYPAALVYLHPNDTYLSNTELISKFKQVFHVPLKMLLKNTMVTAQYSMTPLCHAIFKNVALTKRPDALELSTPIIPEPSSTPDASPVRSISYISPLMLAAALSRNEHMVFLLNQAEMLNIELISMVDEDHDSALHYALYHHNHHGAGLLLDAIEKQIQQALASKDRFLIQRARHLILLQNKEEQSVLHLAVLARSHHAVGRILHLFKLLNVPFGSLAVKSERIHSPFDLINPQDFCPLLTAIHANDLASLQLFLQFIGENPWIRYHPTRINREIQDSEMIPIYAAAFSGLIPDNIRPFLTLIKRSTNILEEPDCNYRIIQTLLVKNPRSKDLILTIASELRIITAEQTTELAASVSIAQFEGRFLRSRVEKRASEEARLEDRAAAAPVKHTRC